MQRAQQKSVKQKNERAENKKRCKLLRGVEAKKA